jgi:hypothetical protein
MIVFRALVGVVADIITRDLHRSPDAVTVLTCLAWPCGDPSNPLAIYIFAVSGNENSIVNTKAAVISFPKKSPHHECTVKIGGLCEKQLVNIHDYQVDGLRYFLQRGWKGSNRIPGLTTYTICSSPLK